MLKILIILMVLGILFTVLAAIIVGAKYEKKFMTSWEKCNGVNVNIFLYKNWKIIMYNN